MQVEKLKIGWVSYIETVKDKISFNGKTRKYLKRLWTVEIVLTQRKGAIAC